MMPMLPEIVPLAAEVPMVVATPVTGTLFLGLLVAAAWFTVFGFLASWMLDRTGRTA